MARKSNKTAHVLGLITNEKKEAPIEEESIETAIETTDATKTSDTDKQPANFSKPKPSIPILEIASGGSSHLSDAIRQNLIQEVFPNDPEFALPKEYIPSDTMAEPSRDVITPSNNVTEHSGDVVTPSNNVTEHSEDIIPPDNNVTEHSEDIIPPDNSVAEQSEVVVPPATLKTEQKTLESSSSLVEATNLSIENELKNSSVQKEIQTALENLFQDSNTNPMIEELLEDSNHSEMLDISTPKPKKVSVVTDFQPSDFSIPTSPLENILMHPDFKYAYINIAEKAVTEKVLEYMKRFNMCTCDRCVVDTIALALTHLPAKYIVTSREDSFALMNYYTLKYNISIISELTKACMVVSENPHHDK
jgi:hypothetical protein